ncbi:MAG: amidohydrolase family protein [Planctomycetes bacterium]|nr:amidohydrolase family protein [Planctomycetota bacterium]
MTILTTILTLAPAIGGVSEPSGGLLAIKVGRAETASGAAIEHAVILVDGGKIIEIGADLPVARGIPVFERPDWVVMPGLVSCYTRLGVDGRAGQVFSPEASPTPEVQPRHPDYKEVLEAGVTTIGLYPPGTGFPGHASALRPHGATLSEMLVEEAAYLKVYFRANAQTKKQVRDAWAKVDEHDEKVKKAKEKFDKDSKAKPAEKKDEEKKDGEAKPAEKKADDKSKDFVPPEADPKVKPFLQVRDGELGMLVSIAQAADWAHWVDAIGERKLDFALRVLMTREIDLFEVKDEIGKRGVRVVMEPQISLVPGTMRQRNLAAELSASGAKVAFKPRNDTVDDHAALLRHVGELIGAGLAREVALKGVTLEPAAVLKLEKQVGSLEKGKAANMLFLNGDPFEPSTQVMAVMLDGEFVSGEVKE